MARKEMTLAVDPGEKHCGVAVFEGESGQCVTAIEHGPRGLEEMLESGEWTRVVIEEFRLYPWRLLEQGFSQVATAKVIGVVEYICRKQGIELVFQPALIKRPTMAHARSRGYKWVSHGYGPHAKDAEVHGLFFFKEALGWNG